MKPLHWKSTPAQQRGTLLRSDTVEPQGIIGVTYFDVKLLKVKMPTQYNGTEEERRALNVYIKLTRAAESTAMLINANLSRYNLTVSQFGVLEAIYHLGPLQPGELAEKILKSSGNMTTVIDNLEKRGLVRRQRREDDRRRIDVFLNEEGKALVETIFPDHIKGVVETFSILSPQEQNQLEHLCKIVGLQKR